jgi:hypothetical protein
MDIIYLFECYDSLYPEDVSAFAKFLESDSARKLQKLAMRKDLYCRIPLETGAFEQEVYFVMKEHMPDWDETIVVFGDGRSTDEIWSDTEIPFRGLSAREKRRAEVSYARQFTKAMKERIQWKLEQDNFELMPYRWVVVAEPGAEEQLQSLGRLRIR